ncbi:MAG: hypothetical protein GC178_06690 [Flavobacteriales bacterium]|nr:hypothetical protein [Flavobacteriales bacterium]
MSQRLKDELRAVISGKSKVRFGATIQAVISNLGTGAPTSTTTQSLKQVKGEEAERISAFARRSGLWQESIDISNYVSEGAEQRVYLKDQDHVLKLNDAIYFETWRDYLHNLLLHNYFFTDTAYELVGFTQIDHVLHAMVKQRFVISTILTDLSEVRSFLETNGFKNTRNNDYLHAGAGVILEDLHDENVLTQNGMLYFIDTVFYLTQAFWTDEHE